MKRYPKFLYNWIERQYAPEWCYAYGGRFDDQVAKVCLKKRGHLESNHNYDRHPLEDPIRTYVIAGNYQQFKYWCNSTKVSPNAKHVVYVARQETLMSESGIGRNVNVVYFGTFYDRADIGAIEQQIQLIRRG